MNCRLVAVLAGLALPASLFCQTVRFRTNLGDIDVNLLPESAPGTVQNFLNYVNRGDYANTFFHRSVSGFVIQAGGYRFVNNQVVPVREDPPILNEFRVSNTRGTLAMAKLGENPHSATNQWFFNLADNSRNLNTQNGGFTVFGRVANSASLAVMDRIAALRTFNAGSPFDQIPLQNYSGGDVTASNLALVTSITVLSPTPAISEGGVASAGSFGALAAASPGSFIEIYGSGLAGTSRAWEERDFTNGRAPTTLEDVSVTINGQPAFVYYVSPTQVNVQVPADVPTGGSVPVVVRSGGQSSAAVQLPIRAQAAGLLAPPAFRVGERQYAAAIRSDGSFVSNGTIPNLPASAARPGETLVFYGIGFGGVTPDTPVAGQIAQGQTSITSQVEFRIGGAPAQITYAGLTPGLVGLYQFNVVVPAGTQSGDAQVAVSLNGENLPQELYVSVQ